MTVAAVIPVARGSSVAVRKGRPFLWLLLIATAIPFVFMPATAGLGHPVSTIRWTSKTIVFLASGAHVSSSYYFYLDPGLRPTIGRHRGRFVAAPIALIALSAVFYVVATSEQAASFVLLYLMWQTHHYTRQNIGVLAFSAKATGTASPSQLERAAVTTCGWAGVIGMITLSSLYLNTPLRRYGWQVHTLGRLVFAGALILGALALPRVWRTGDPFRVVFFLICALFYTPIFVFHNPVAIVGYAYAHGFQYLIMMAFVGVNGRRGVERLVAPIALSVIAILGGWLLAAMQVGSHWGRLANVVFGAYLVPRQATLAL